MLRQLSNMSRLNYPPRIILQFEPLGCGELWTKKKRFRKWETHCYRLNLLFYIDELNVEYERRIRRNVGSRLFAVAELCGDVAAQREQLEEDRARLLVELRRAESDDTQGVPAVDPVDPAEALCGDLRAVSRCGE